MIIAVIFAIIRIVLGAVFVWLGAQKLRDHDLLYGGLMHALEEHGAAFPYYQKILLRFVEPHQEIFIYATAIGELLLGASLLLGLLVSLATVGGAFLVINIALATTWGNWMMFTAHIALALLLLILGRAGSGLVLGLDGWLVGQMSEAIVLFPLRRRAPELRERRSTANAPGRVPTAVRPAPGRVPGGDTRR